MTSLYIAVKLYEPGILTPSSFVELSRGFFTEEHVTTMEESILRTLSWHLHPPTYLSFIREMLLLVQQTKCSHSEYHEIVEISRFLTELAVCDYFFVTRKPSSVALACILNALGCIHDEIKRDSIYSQFTRAIQDIAELDCVKYEVEECRERLHEIYLQGGYKKQDQVSLDRFENTSPVGVASINQTQDPRDDITL